MAEIKDVVFALRCSSTPGKVDCRKGCPYYCTERDEDFFKLTGMEEIIGCDVDRIATDAADLLEKLEDDGK